MDIKKQKGAEVSVGKEGEGKGRLTKTNQVRAKYEEWPEQNTKCPLRFQAGLRFAAQVPGARLIPGLPLLWFSQVGIPSGGRWSSGSGRALPFLISF